MRLKLQLFALKKNMVAVNDGVKTLELKNSDKKQEPENLIADPNVEATPDTLSLVDQKTQDKINSTYTQSKTVTGEQADAKKALGNLKSVSGVTDIIDQGTWDAINTPFQATTAYQEAYNYTQQLLQQLSSGRTSYTDQINSMMSEIQNREKFSYDVDSDMLFQQYLASSMASGKMAMQDTMGQAAALTGGYGSTYATAAGNQQYNAYIQDAYNNLPEYYNMALEAYQMEGEEMYKQLAMLNDADRTEYERLFNSWSANNSTAQQMYQNEYTAWQDGVNNALNSANLQLNEQGQIYDQAYNTYNAINDHAQQSYQNEYTRWADEVSKAYEYYGMKQDDYWNNQSLIEEKRQFDESLKQKDDQFKEEMGYKKESLKQDQSQFESSQAAKNNSDSVAGTAIDQKHFDGALEAYNTGGMEGLNQYLGSLSGEYGETELNTIAEHVGMYGEEPVTAKDYTLVSKGGWNWGFGIDNNGKASDGIETYTMKQLYEIAQDQGMSEADAKKWVMNLQKNLGITAW